MEKIKKTIRGLLPIDLTNKINRKRDQIKLNRLQNNILSYYSNISSEKITNEIKEVLDYIISNGVSYFPYNFKNNYKIDDIKVYDDPDTNFKYVIHQNKKLFFKKSWNEDEIKKYYLSLIVEQDEKSPHKYLTRQFNVDENDVLVDVGVAEGNFSLSVIEKVSKVYMFEADYEWIEAINLTFSPWKDKIEIISKFVSDNNSGNCIKLDDYFKNIKFDFIKIDVDGAESKLLDGAKKIISNNDALKIAICTYHKQNDEDDFTKLLEKFGFTVNHSDGYMIFYDDKKQFPPYLRRGLLRAERK
jgi:hypothetical protein